MVPNLKAGVAFERTHGVSGYVQVKLQTWKADPESRETKKCTERLIRFERAKRCVTYNFKDKSEKGRGRVEEVAGENTKGGIGLKLWRFICCAMSLQAAALIPSPYHGIGLALPRPLYHPAMEVRPWMQCSPINAHRFGATMNDLDQGQWIVH